MFIPASASSSCATSGAKERRGHVTAGGGAAPRPCRRRVPPVSGVCPLSPRFCGFSVLFSASRGLLGYPPPGGCLPRVGPVAAPSLPLALAAPTGGRWPKGAPEPSRGHPVWRCSARPWFGVRHPRAALPPRGEGRSFSRLSPQPYSTVHREVWGCCFQLSRGSAGSFGFFWELW